MGRRADDHVAVKINYGGLQKHNFTYTHVKNESSGVNVSQNSSCFMGESHEYMSQPSFNQYYKKKKKN